MRIGPQAAFFTAEKLKMLATNAFDQKIKKKQPTENYYHSSSLIKKEINFTYFYNINFCQCKTDECCVSSNKVI